MMFWATFPIIVEHPNIFKTTIIIVPDEASVDQGGTVVVDHPEQETTLDQRVEGNPEENVVGEELEDAEIAEMDGIVIRME